MKAAIICPTPELGELPSTGIHLVLSHLLDDPVYSGHYGYLRARGDYLILDNGAHENGEGEDPASLLSKCVGLFAQELVLPDVLFEGRKTVERTTEMLKWIQGEGRGKWATTRFRQSPSRLMLVPQGETEKEWADSLKGLLDAWDRYTPQGAQPVIGISKDYDYWKGGLPGLIGKYVRGVYWSRSIEIHCLGWPSNLWTLTEVAEEYPWVRSTDSAKPHVYAYNGIRLEQNKPFPVYPRRTDTFFSTKFIDAQRDIARNNVDVFVRSVQSLGESAA